MECHIQASTRISTNRVYWFHKGAKRVSWSLWMCTKVLVVAAALPVPSWVELIQINMNLSCFLKICLSAKKCANTWLSRDVLPGHLNFDCCCKRGGVAVLAKNCCWFVGFSAGVRSASNTIKVRFLIPSCRILSCFISLHEQLPWMCI